jgi:enhancing lycopene biosynthesis protein 2
MKVGVLLAGCGVYDGSEIHEATLSLLAIDEAGHEAVCFAPDKDQHHVINHITGEVTEGSRNVLVESARIARGNIKSIKDINTDDFDCLLIPGGFGAAKNLNQWAISGPEGEIDDSVQAIILNTVRSNKPLGAVCMGPTVIAKAMEGSGLEYEVTVGSKNGNSPYDIDGISKGIESIGGKVAHLENDSINIDNKNKIVTGPCYMMDATIKDIRDNTKMVVEKLIELAS